MKKSWLCLYISAFLTQSKSIIFHFDNISTSILFTFVLDLINKTTETMTSFAFSLILSAALNTPSLPLAAPNDSIQHRDIKEITVYSIAAGNLSLPYVSVDKRHLKYTTLKRRLMPCKTKREFGFRAMAFGLHR